MGSGQFVITNIDSAASSIVSVVQPSRGTVVQAKETSRKRATRPFYEP